MYTSTSWKGLYQWKSTVAAHAVTSQPEYVDLVSQEHGFSGTQRDSSGHLGVSKCEVTLPHISRLLIPVSAASPCGDSVVMDREMHIEKVQRRTNVAH